MKKLAKDLKAGDTIVVGAQKLEIKRIELSELGKQGTSKCRIEASTPKGESVVIIRPSDYPFTVE